MRCPANLTQREREIIPLLLSGATREEIAMHFALSPETVKVHSENIFRKFDAVKLRDCFKALNLYQLYFGIGGMGVHVHVVRGEQDFTFNSDRRSASWKRSMDLLVVDGPLRKIERGFDPLMSKLQLEYQCEHAMKTHYSFSGGLHCYVAEFDEPIQRGATLNFLERSSMTDLFTEQSGVDNTLIAAPFSYRQLRYHFPKTDIPDTIECITRLGADIADVKGVEFWLEDNVFNIELTDFEIPFRVEVSWRYNSDKQ